MALFKIHKFREQAQIAHFLAGGIVGTNAFTKARQGPPGVYDLVGATLTFLQPIGSVTFVAGGDYGGLLTFKDVKEQIENAVVGVLVCQVSTLLGFVESAPSTGLVLSASPPGGYGTIHGDVDMNTLEYGADGTVDTKTLSLEVNTEVQDLITFDAPANRAAIVSQINAVIVDALASIDGKNQLMIRTTEPGPTKKIKVLGGTAVTDLGFVNNQSGTGATKNNANALLGFDQGTDTTGLVYTSPYPAAAVPPNLIFAYMGPDVQHTLITYE